MSKVRKQLSAEQRAQIVRQHLGGKEQVSDLADEFGGQKKGRKRCQEPIIDLIATPA